MPVNLDVRDLLLRVSSLLSGLTVTARSQNFEALRDMVAQALEETEAQTIVTPANARKKRLPTVGRNKWRSNGKSWH